MIEQVFVRFDDPTVPHNLDRLPMLMRAMPGMRLERNHWTYSGLRPDGTRVGLWGGDALYPVANSADLQAPMLIEHCCDERAPKQIERNKKFLARVAEYVTEHGREP